MELKYIDINDYEVIESPLKNKGIETGMGYGSKIPTSKMLRYNGKLHRIYCMCYSNIGSCYIISKGEKLFVN